MYDFDFLESPFAWLTLFVLAPLFPLFCLFMIVGTTYATYHRKKNMREWLAYKDRMKLNIDDEEEERMEWATICDGCLHKNPKCFALRMGYVTECKFNEEKEDE